MKSLLNMLAENSHESLSVWIRYMFSRCIKDESGSMKIPANFVKIWNRQMNTSYKDLPSEEKGLSMQNAESALKTFDNFIDDAMTFTHDELDKIKS